MTQMIEIIDLLVKRGYHTILQIENCRIAAGEFVTLLGANGAGKTTFLKCCCGLIQPTRGTVRFAGQQISRVPPWQPSHYRRQIGYIPQQAEYNAHLPFTVREVVALGRNARKPLFKSLDKSDYEKVDFWLSELGLYERRRQTFRSLSGGQQQKALIARAMVGEPHLVLLDEPGANLDPHWKKQLRDVLDRLFSEYELTALLISHELSLIPAACRRIILLSEGRNMQDGPLEEVLDSEFARALFGGVACPAGGEE